MDMENTEPKPNLLALFAKNKKEAANNSGPANSSQISRFPRPVNSRPLAKRGGRNGQGKPS